MFKRIYTHIFMCLILTVGFSYNCFASETKQTIETTGKILVFEQASSNSDLGILLWALCLLAIIVIFIYICFNVYKNKIHERKRVIHETRKPKLVITQARLSSEKENYDL